MDTGVVVVGVEPDSFRGERETGVVAEVNGTVVLTTGLVRRSSGSRSVVSSLGAAASGPGSAEIFTALALGCVGEPLRLIANPAPIPAAMLTAATGSHGHDVLLSSDKTRSRSPSLSGSAHSRHLDK